MEDSNDPTTPSPEPASTPTTKSRTIPDPKTPATPNVKSPAAPAPKAPGAQVLAAEPSSPPAPTAQTPNPPAVPATASQAAATETTNVQPAIAADPPEEWEADSTVDDDEVASSTASINSTILEYRKLHGRTFHVFCGVDYWGPNDDIQLNGQDINHHMIYLALGDKLHLAPVENPQRVLDVGTGTGIWAIDFADEHPTAEVIGVDLAPTQPSWVPPNCKFELDDLSKPWTFPEAAFDYIHIRWMMGCIEDWVQLYREAYRCLKPGGWIEHMDCSIVIRSNNDSHPPAGGIWHDWWRAFTECTDKTGRTLRIVDDDVFAGWMREAGFPEVMTKPVITPIGDWPADKRMKEVGTFNKLAAEMGLEGYVLYLMTTVLGWDYAQVQVWLAQIRAALRNKSHQPYMTWGVAWAQKPKN